MAPSVPSAAPTIPPAPSTSQPTIVAPLIRPAITSLPVPVPALPPPIDMSTSDIGMKPAPFKGNQSKSKEFKLRIRLFLRANGTKYKDDLAKVLLFLDLCQGPITGAWAVQHVEEILDSDAAKLKNSSYACHFDALDQLITHFDTDFSPLDVTTNNRDARPPQSQNGHMTSGGLHHGV